MERLSIPEHNIRHGLIRWKLEKDLAWIKVTLHKDLLYE